MTTDIGRDVFLKLSIKVNIRNRSLISFIVMNLQLKESLGQKHTKVNSNKITFRV